MHASVKDTLNLLSKLSFRRVFNLFLLYYSYLISRLFKTGLHLGMPASISVEPTTHCNLGCPQCPSGLKEFSRPTGSMNMETFKTIIDSLHKDLLYLILYFQGEPLKNTSFPDMVKYASSKRIYTATSTNGHFLYSSTAKKIVESGLDRLIVSVDGADQQTYSQYRIGGELSRVKEGIKNLVHWKKELKSATPFLILQFVVFKHNEHQIDEVLQMGKDLGVDKVELKSAQVYTLEKGDEIVSSIERFARYRKGKEGRYSIKSELPDRCFRMWRGCVFTWDGQVVPCCFDKDGSYRFGSINKDSFRVIWRSPAYNDFRDRILKSRKDIDICRNCSEGLKA